MSYKFFTYRFGTDAIEAILDLRKEFPSCKYIRGIHKDKEGIWCIKDLDTKEYGEKEETEKGDIFVSPSESNLELIKSQLSTYESNWVDRIPVKLKTGITLNIFPASAIPKKVILGLKKKENSDEPYNTRTEYGKLAYKLFNRSQSEESLRFDDPDFIEIIKLSLLESYILPIELWDVLGVISTGDYDTIFAAALGFDYEHLLGEVKKSNSV